MGDLHVSFGTVIKLYNEVQPKAKVTSDKKNEMLLNDLLNSQSLISNSQFKGLSPDCIAVTQIDQLLKQAIIEEKQVSSFLNFTCFDDDVLKTALDSLLTRIGDSEIMSEMRHDELFSKVYNFLPDLVNCTLTENIDATQSISEDTSVSLEILSMIGGLLVQPGLSFIGESCSKTLLDAWDLTPCPICGRIPSVVIKPETDVWAFSCSFCGTRYKMDIFTCPHCQSEGSQNKEFHIVGDHMEYEIVECKECKHYYKIINTARLQQSIPEGLEDSQTRVLDEIATGYGLTRIDE